MGPRRFVTISKTAPHRNSLTYLLTYLPTIAENQTEVDYYMYITPGITTTHVSRVNKGDRDREQGTDNELEWIDCNGQSVTGRKGTPFPAFDLWLIAFRHLSLLQWVRSTSAKTKGLD